MESGKLVLLFLIFLLWWETRVNIFFTMKRKTYYTKKNFLLNSIFDQLLVLSLWFFSDLLAFWPICMPSRALKRLFVYQYQAREMARMRILYGNRKTDYIEMGIWEKKNRCRKSLSRQFIGKFVPPLWYIALTWFEQIFVYILQLFKMPCIFQ